MSPLGLGMNALGTLGVKVAVSRSQRQESHSIQRVSVMKNGNLCAVISQKQAGYNNVDFF